MSCKTPEINVPPRFRASRPSEKRKKRDTRETTAKLPSVRRRRQSGEESSDQISFATRDMSLTFYLGFKLDGQDAYKDLRVAENLTEYAVITVYASPEIVAKSLDDRVPFRKGENIRIEVSADI